MTSPGRFIVLEGGEGAGKSTHAHAVQAWLENKGRQTQLTREPGGSPLAEAIRGVVLGDWHEGIDPTTEALLIFAARAAHVRATIRPALQAGTDVICDRFVDASYAYQGAGRGLSKDWLAELESHVLGDLKPDLVILLDIDPQLGMQRAKARGDLNRFDTEALAFMHRVRAAYLQRALADPKRYAVIDGSEPKDVVSQSIIRVLEQRL
jgi:dTMP kinase